MENEAQGQHKRDLKMNRSLKTHSTSNASIYIVFIELLFPKGWRQENNDIKYLRHQNVRAYIQNI